MTTGASARLPDVIAARGALVALNRALLNAAPRIFAAQLYRWAWARPSKQGEGMVEAATPEPHVYTVLCRSRASAIFSPGETLVVNYNTGNAAVVEISFSTRFEEKGFEVKVPTLLVAEATGPAPGLTAAVETFANMARSAAAVFTVSVNAWMGDLGAEIAYDSTPGLREREFSQETTRGAGCR